MRKFLVVLLAFMMAVSMFTACSKDSDLSSGTGDSSGMNDSSSSGGEEVKEYVTVTFKQDGQADVVLTVEKNTALTDIPVPAAVKGYTVKWDVADFGSIGADLTVNAVATANSYKIVFDYSGSGFEGPAYIDVTFDSEFTFPENTNMKYVFEGVKWLDAETEEEVVAGVYSFDKDITVKLSFTERRDFIEVEA